MRNIVPITLAAMAAVVLAGCPAPICVGPDPAATSVQYTKLTEPLPGTGTVRITGVVKNIGSANYVSGPEQQVAQLLEDNKVVSETKFQNLAAGDSVEVVHERAWSKADEFQPDNYSVRILYDPDILMDGNAANDDCNTSNNTRTRDAQEINSLF